MKSDEKTAESVAETKTVDVDVEAPRSKLERKDHGEKEDPSVVMTADDSSISASSMEFSGSVEKKEMTKATAKKTPWRMILLTCIAALLIGGLAAAVVVMSVGTDEDVALGPTGINEGEQDTTAPATEAPVDTVEPIETPPEAPEEEPAITAEDEESEENPEYAAVEPVTPPEPMYDLPTELPFPDLPPIRSFSKDVLQGYATLDQLEEDLVLAAKHFLNRVILQNAYNYAYYSHHAWQPSEPDAEAAEAAGVSAAAAQAATTTTSMSKTNNQEPDADEADHVKNDDKYIYAAYGDYLVVWDHQGKRTTQVQMPSNEDGFAQGSGWGWAPPTTNINGLLLTPDHVVVVVDGSAPHGYDGDADDFFQEHQGAQIRVYTKPDAVTGDMTLIGKHALAGIYRDGRWMEESQTVQLITSGEIDAYPHLVSPLSMQRVEFDGMTPIEYARAAADLASTTLIPHFAKGVARAFRMNNGDLPTMLMLNEWSLRGLPVKSVDDLMKGGFSAVDTPMKSFVQVASLAAKDFVTATESEALPVAASSFLSPTTNCLFYGTDNDLVLAVSLQRHNETKKFHDEELFLLHLQVSEEGTKFHSLAGLDGSIGSRFNMDILGNDLRIATTLQKWNPMDRVKPLCGDVSEVLYGNDNCLTEANWDQCFNLAIDGCQDVVKAGCPYEFTCADDEDYQKTSSTDNFVIVLDIATGGDMMERGRVRIGEPHEVATAVRFGENFSYAMTFDQRDPFYVLQLEPEQPPAILGSLKLDGFSRYLHPLNDDATLLVGIGQNTTGSGLNQINTGVMITVFDVSDMAKPVAVASHMLEKDDRLESYTLAEWEAKAVQYADGKLIIPVSMFHNGWEEVGDDEMWFTNEEANMEDFVDEEDTAPQKPEEPGPKNFEGFIVFNVGSTGISEAFKVNHIRSEPTCHYCNGGLLDSRSLLLDNGSLITMDDNSVQSTNIETGETLWMMNVTVEGVPLDCCW